MCIRDSSNGVAIPYVPQAENHKIPAVKRGKESDKQNLDDKKEIASSVSIKSFNTKNEGTGTLDKVSESQSMSRWLSA